MRSSRVAALLPAITLVLLAWTAIITLTGGVYLRIPLPFGPELRVSSRDPFRPSVLAIAVMLVYAAVFRSQAASHAAAAQRAIERASPVLAIVLTLSVFVIGMRHGSFVAAASDAYGYVSQAALWLAGDPIVEQPLASRLPWPGAEWTLSPLGYRPTPGQPFGTIVPTYASGLPLLMAAGTIVLGVAWLPGCGPYVVVPALGALMVWLTYRLGRRVLSPIAGLAAAALLASSPAFVAMLLLPMSDVPVASFFTLAVVLALSDLRARGLVDVRALATGLAVSLAILVRPNLVVVASVFAIAVWLRAPAGRARWLAIAAFAAGTLPGVATVALINAHLYGAPWTSGYGDIAGYYAWRYAPINAAHYTRWLFETQTPFFFAGLLLIPFAVRRRIPAAWRAPIALFGGVSLAIVLSYLFYLPFDPWEYLRFMLTMFPLLLVLALMGCWLVTSRLPAALRAAVLTSIVLLVIGYQIDRARQYQLLARWQHDAGTVSAARYVERRLPRNAVLLSFIHSGSLRHYAGRLTLRFDQLDQAWWPRALDVLAAEGYRPYVVMSEFEEAAFRQHGRSPGRLVAELPGPVVRIYDPLDSDGASGERGEPVVIPALTPCPCTERDGTRPR